MNKFKNYLLRLALTGRLPFGRLFLAWQTKRELAAMGPRSSLIYEFEIPDPSRPIPEDQRGALSPSAELIPFTPDAISEADVIGRTVEEIFISLGTYGMGGAGFFGLRLGEEILVVAIWGAGEWITVDGVLVEDLYVEDVDRPQPWVSQQGDRLSPRIVEKRSAASQ